ncbi:UNVERIFIED_ORG: hypothetical protein GGD58_005752 [Rhizobium pisi]
MGSPPATTGPGGQSFEAKVAASYLVGMLCGDEPRDLPGMAFTKLKLQGASAGFALDDIVIHAIDRENRPAIMEIQAKRTMSFSPSDTQFKSLIKQMASASFSREWQHHRLAVAVDRTLSIWSVIDVLNWARTFESAEPFMRQLEVPGVANDKMRSFTNTFRDHLGQAGANNDDISVWQLLRRFWIQVYDFSSDNSGYEHLLVQRLKAFLPPTESNRARDLWARLQEIVATYAINAGELSKDTLVRLLSDFPLSDGLSSPSQNLRIAPVTPTFNAVLIAPNYVHDNIETLWGAHSEAERYNETAKKIGVMTDACKNSPAAKIELDYLTKIIPLPHRDDMGYARFLPTTIGYVQTDLVGQLYVTNLSDPAVILGFEKTGENEIADPRWEALVGEHLGLENPYFHLVKRALSISLSASGLGVSLAKNGSMPVDVNLSFRARCSWDDLRAQVPDGTIDVGSSFTHKWQISAIVGITTAALLPRYLAIGPTIRVDYSVNGERAFCMRQVKVAFDQSDPATASEVGWLPFNLKEFLSSWARMEVARDHELRAMVREFYANRYDSP